MSISVGMKIYSYCYGPMTVKSVNENYVTASVDNPRGFSSEFAKLCGGKDLGNVQFKTAAFGHWYFDNAADVIAGKENNDFPEANQQSGTPKAMTRNDAYLHADFGVGSETYPVDHGDETYPVDKGGITYPVAKNQ